MSKRIFANMVAVAVMIAMAVPAMAQDSSGANYGAGVSEMEIFEFGGFPQTYCENVPFPGNVVARVGGNGNTLTLFIEVDGKVVFSQLRPTNNAVTTYDIYYNECWDLEVSVGIRGNSIISVAGEWIEKECVCAQCLYLDDVTVANVVVVYEWRENQGVWRALTIDFDLVLWFSDGTSSVISRTENRVDIGDKEGSNIRKNVAWSTSCVGGTITYDIVLTGENKEGFVDGVIATFVTNRWFECDCF